ncbi:PAAR domain-containing protein [Oscillochloris sp. ZM17-4]|uniref:PAAR domain-containing protein n=1 Tax=Oscillochloris sp. ZM17-4 TaxID=2866714 RepID=UPI001C7342C7|nr:PAAR domain-containing protein [Oscillochloris sp. ZM17-4]MBX0331212.1 PAAR domain-containing protein [Oscillochloris sp. ZM17-4]
MGKLAARQGDRVVATDIHIILVPAAAGAPVPTPTPLPFSGALDGGLSADVRVNSRPAATQGSTATNTPPHIPAGGPFQRPPSNRSQIVSGSLRVQINGKPAARAGDTALTCNDPVDLPNGSVVVTPGARPVSVGD